MYIRVIILTEVREEVKVMEDMEELKELESEIEALAKELNIEEKHLERIFNGSYTSISLTKKGKRRVVLLSHLAHKINGKVHNPPIKSARDDNFEAIQKMQKFLKLVKLYMFLRRMKGIDTRVKERLAVSLVS